MQTEVLLLAPTYIGYNEDMASDTEVQSTTNRDKYENINSEIIKLKAEKEKNQPTKIKTSGSTFKNPISQTEKKVWQLIKESVPLDISFGDACISEKHSNFFVNKGDAKFNDMKKLIDFVAESVFKKTGISIEKEIKILEN